VIRLRNTRRVAGLALRPKDNNQGDNYANGNVQPILHLIF
jgi:hypothetical protein